MFCFLPFAFYILTFILFDFLPFDFYRFWLIAIDFLAFDFYPFWLLALDFYQFWLFAFDFLHFNFNLFRLFAIWLLSLLIFCIWLSTFDFYLFDFLLLTFCIFYFFASLTFLFWLFAFDFLSFWLLSVLTSCQLTFILFDFLHLTFRFWLFVFWLNIIWLFVRSPPIPRQRIPRLLTAAQCDVTVTSLRPYCPNLLCKVILVTRTAILHAVDYILLGNVLRHFLWNFSRFPPSWLTLHFSTSCCFCTFAQKPYVDSGSPYNFLFIITSERAQRAERDLSYLREKSEYSRPDPARPGPTRPDPTRPHHVL